MIMTNRMEGMNLYDQSDEVIEKYEERATKMLIESAWLPLSDDVWATDKYSDVIADKAQQLWEDDQV